MDKRTGLRYGFRIAIGITLTILLLGQVNIEEVRGETGLSIVDQSFTSTGDINVISSINECCAYVAQTFTAGITGEMIGVKINVNPFGNPTSNLHVAIHTVENGLPTLNVLGSTTLNSAGSSLSELITLPQPIPIVAGVQYAIVLNYINAPPPGAEQGYWFGRGFRQDFYKGGESLALRGTDWVNGWIGQGRGTDNHFQTYVIPDSDEEIPEFPTVALPILSIIGLMFLFQRRKGK